MEPSKKFLKEGYYKAGEGESLQEKEPAENSTINEEYKNFEANYFSTSYEGYQATENYGLSDSFTTNLFNELFNKKPSTALSPAKKTDVATKSSDKPISIFDIPTLEWPESLAPIRNAHDEPIEIATIAPVVDYGPYVDYAMIDYGPYGDYPVSIDKYYHRFYSNNILDSPKNEPSSSIPNHGYGNRQSPARYEQRYCGNGPPKSRNNNYRSVNFERPFSTEKKVSKNGHDDRFYSPAKKRFERSRDTDQSSSFAKKNVERRSRPVDDRFTAKKEFERRRLDGRSSPYKKPEYNKSSHHDDRNRPRKDDKDSHEYQNKYPSGRNNFKKNYGRNERKPYDRRYRHEGYSKSIPFSKDFSSQKKDY